MAESFEFAVVGGGLLGLSVARALAQREHEVVLLERSTIGNPRAGSKGNARIFRYGYEDPFYVRLAMASKPMWRELEAETGRSLLSHTGQLSFGGDLEELRTAMSEAGAPFDDLDEAETALRVPGIRADGPSVFEPESGVLAADVCLAALRQSATALEVEILENSRVTSVADDGDGVRLTVERSEESEEDNVSVVDASVAIVCAGHWSERLLRDAGIGLRLVATLEQAVFLSPIPGTDTSVPVFIERQDPWVYGLPVGGEGPGLLKVAMHHAGPPADPDLAPLDPDPEQLASLAEHAERLLPGYYPEPATTERCFYDTSSDTDFVVDRIGRVVIGAGTSGHGFKFGPLLGELLSDLATAIPPRFDLGRFSARRPAVSD